MVRLKKRTFVMIFKTLPVTVFVLLLIMVSKAWAIGVVNTETTNSGYTNTDVVLLVVFVLLALIVSFLCSVAEAVLLSITPSYIARLREVKPKLAKLLKRLKQDNVDQSLAAILTLNTIAHTVGAVGSGAKAAVVFGSVWVGMFSAVMTLMILFLSEIIPKTLGAVFWRKLTGVTAIFVRGLILGLYPLIKISEGLTRLIARRKDLHLFSRDEFIAMAGIGEQAGQIDHLSNFTIVFWKEMKLHRISQNSTRFLSDMAGVSYIKIFLEWCRRFVFAWI